MSRPWGVHSVFNIWSAGVYTRQGDRQFMAVAHPYDDGRIRAAWWVLTGRAHAVVWPKPGDLELALNPKRSLPQEPLSNPTPNTKKGRRA